MAAAVLTLCHDGVGGTLLTVTPPASGAPARKRIAAVVDVSYSMHGAANDRGDEVTRYFSKARSTDRAQAHRPLFGSRERRAPAGRAPAG
jgi:hypothetical protein